MIIIKIQLEMTVSRLEAVVSLLRLYLMQENEAFTNGKVNGSRKDTLMYQVVLKLTDKLLRKLSDKKLAPPKSKTFKIKLNYCEAYYLFSVLLNIDYNDAGQGVLIDNVIKQLDQQL